MKISYEKQEEKIFDKNETNKNLGLLLGLYCSWFSKNPYFIRLGLEANLFPVGLSTLFLVTARQQVLFFETGIYL